MKKGKLSSITIERERKKYPKLCNYDTEYNAMKFTRCPELPLIQENDYALFLHSGGYYEDQVAVTIICFFTQRSLHMSSTFCNRDPVNCEKIRRALDTVAIFPLQDRTPEENFKVFVLQMLDPKNYDQDMILKVFTMILDLHTYEEGANDGCFFIVDLKGLTMDHCTEAYSEKWKKFFEYCEIAPIKWTGIYFVHSSSEIDYEIIEYLRVNILSVYSHMASFVDYLSWFDDYVPKNIRPNELDGTAGPIKTLYEDFKKKIIAHRQLYLDLDDYIKYDVSNSAYWKAVIGEIEYLKKRKTMNIDL